MKFQGLISDDITPLIDSSLEQIRKQEALSVAEMKKLMEKASEKIFTILEDKCADFFVDRFTLKHFHKHFCIGVRNNKRIVDKHEDMFTFFFAYVHTGHIVYNRFLDKMSAANFKPAEIELKDRIHLCLYGNICRQADQIGTALTHGHMDAALRLWRSFYEHCVVAVFLMRNNSNELCERFRDATHKQNMKSAESYIKRHETLKFPKLEEDIVAEIERQFQEKKHQYDKDFFDSEYSWAKAYVQQKPSFIALEEAAEMDRYRPFYIWASSKIHPTFKGIADFRDSAGNIVLSHITTPETDRKALVDPAQLTLAAFHHVNNLFLHLYAGYEYDINQLIFQKIYDRFGETLSAEKVKEKS